jgi:hypothetical protein
MGYTQNNWKQLLEDIKRYHLTKEAEPIERVKYGQKYMINEDVPRFITIYPEGGKNEV